MFKYVIRSFNREGKIIRRREFFHEAYALSHYVHATNMGWKVEVEQKWIEEADEDGRICEDWSA